MRNRFESIADRLSSLCVGVDPSPALLESWGLPRSGTGLRKFCEIVVESLQGVVGFCKPQVAFFEAFGPEGFIALQELIQNARQAGLVVIADAKRGDVPHVSEAYGNAWLGADSPMDVDAVTAHAYLGFDSLRPLIAKAHAEDAVVFVVVRSSNPEGTALQTAAAEQPSTSVAEHLADAVCAANVAVDADAIGPVGAVVGATLDGLSPLLDRLGNSLLLVPGVGAQGATIEDVARRFGPAARRAIPSVSRAVLSQGPSVAAVRGAAEQLAQRAITLRR